MKKNLAEECLKNTKTKKISINLDEDTLAFIDEFSELSNVTRTTVIMSMLGSGINELIKSFEISIIKAKKESSKPEKAEAVLKKLEKFKNKWKIRD
jgi:hypothetical protein